MTMNDLRTKPSFWRLPLFFFLGLFLATNTTLAAEKTITIAYPAQSMSWFPVYVAEKKGFFREEGLQPVLVLMRSNIAITALVTQEIDYTTSTAVATGAANGMPIRVVMGLAQRTLFSLVVVPEITFPRELKGKVLGVATFGALQAVVTEDYVKRIGLEPGKSVKLIALGADAARMAALEKRLIHGTLLPPPGNVYAEKLGYRILARAEEMASFPQASVGTHTEKIRKQREEVRKVISAVLRGSRLIQREPEEGIRLIRDWDRLSASDARRVYELIQGAYAENGRFDEREIRAMAQVGQEPGRDLSQISIKDIVDFSPLDEVVSKLRR
jgi:NitT/TauT family transport system substrate-binding protein